MAIRRVTPDEASELLEAGWTFVDVRSIPEYREGHPAGAYNVPLNHAEPGRGMVPNSAFSEVVQRAFDKSAKLIVGCKSGNRSYKAAQKLAELGYEEVVDMRGGFAGELDRQTGGVACEGWKSRGLPVASEAEPGRDYASLAEDAPSGE